MLNFKKLFLLLPLVLLGVNTLLAQDDELPPPTSKPKTETPKDGQPARESNFQGFKKPKKVDLSKFIIEPNFNFAISSNRVDFGLSPYVGYNVWKGLYAGGGITYFYTGFSGIQVTSGTSGAVVGTMNAHFHTYGAGTFLQYDIWNGFFARAKLEVLHRSMDDINQAPIPRNPGNLAEGFYFPKKEITIPDLLLGVGYNMLRSKNFFFPIIVSYNVLNSITDTTYSIYPRGWVVQLGFVNVF